MKTHALCTLLLALSVVTPLDAAELVPRIENNALTVAIHGLDFPASVRQDLVSGLTNHILIRVTLATDGRPPARSTIDVAIRYDLWEESFRMTMSVDGRSLPPRTLRDMDATIAFLADLAVSGLFATTELERGRAYTAQAEVLFDPIDRDRMEKIRQWVARNSAFPTQVSGGGSSPAAADLFNRIFEQYAAGAEFAAVWRQTVTSRPFRPEEVGWPP